MSGWPAGRAGSAGWPRKLEIKLNSSQFGLAWAWLELGNLCLFNSLYVEQYKVGGIVIVLSLNKGNISSILVSIFFCFNAKLTLFNLRGKYLYFLQS